MKCWKNGVLIVTAIMMVHSAHAVDGYKNMKFGMSKQEIIDQKPCWLRPGTGAPVGVESLQCFDFKFAGSQVIAAFFFIDDKFERVGIMLGKGQAMGLHESLTKKYGTISSSSTQEQLNSVDTTPNSSGFVAFDNDTVYLQFMSDASMQQSVVLIYTSRDYETRIKKLLSEVTDSDI